ncbi:MAG: DNA polymerase III subunit epsilon [Proteobacteria bacterium]|nr:DNA polymerase III subunit epsilon [Pseudomonadota bacterium]
MRQIVLDTETTGLDPESGHRIIEIGCVEIENRRTTKRYYHQYINPERDIDVGAIEVHGLTTEFLASKPKFAEIAEEFLAFVRGAELIIHNAPFDTGFLDHEFSLLGLPDHRAHEYCRITDTLMMARDLHPGQRNNLDALCRRYEIDNTHRDLHGALLDAELLADVYLAMTGGQVDLQLSAESRTTDTAGSPAGAPIAGSRRAAIPVIQPTELELALHYANLDKIDALSATGCVWLRQLDATS